MIPKTIHYCWFGRGDKPKLTVRCIDSWKKFCPNYELVEWDEDNFDINSNMYARQAYENKKYAFVSDYVRLYALHHYGGIYMDTDVEVVRPLDNFLLNQAFAGFELPYCIQTAILACEKGFNLFEEFLDYYRDASFVKPDGTLDFTTNVDILTRIVEKYGLKKDGSFQIVNGLALYPREYFCPLDDITGKIHKTIDTATIHWFSKSWISPKIRFRSKVTKVFHRIFGKNCFVWLKRIINNY